MPAPVVVIALASLMLLHDPDPARPSAERLRAIVESLAHDSTVGRRTPSAELDKAARYIESQLRAAGAAPFGDEGSFFQRYPVVESLLSDRTGGITIGSNVRWIFGRDFYYAGGAGGDPKGELRGKAVIVTGKITNETAAHLSLRNKIVFFLSPLNARGGPDDFRSAFAIGGAGARAVILPAARPDTLWRRLSADREEFMPGWSPAWQLWWEPTRDTTSQSFRPILELWNGRWQEFVKAAAIDTLTLRNADGSPRVVELADEVILSFAREMQRVSWPSNVLGVIQGSDPVLRNEYVIVSAHYDGLGTERGRPPGPASVLNGADDNASGVAVLVEVARAITGSRPKRSIIFAAVSGEENGLWGSDHLAGKPPVPISAIVANVNADMVGRPVADTVYITGRGAGAVGKAAQDAITRSGAHGMTVVDEVGLERRYPGQRADERSDHANFKRRGIPAISFFTGWHADYHETTDDPAKVNFIALEKVASMVQDVTLAIANSRALRH